MKEQLKVLIVEDAAADAELVEQQLKREGLNCAVKVAATKEAFLKELKDFAPDVVLANCSLPDLKGEEELEAVRGLSPDLPVVFISDSIGEEKAVELYKLGAAGYVLKERLHHLGPMVRRVLFEAGERRERRLAQEALAASEGRLRSVVDLASDAIVVYDSQGIIMSWNHAAERLYGYTVDEAVGKSYSMVVVPRLREAFARALAQAVATGELVHGRKPFESAHCRKDGSEFPVEITTSPWRTGEAVYVTTVTRDISERKRMEQALKDSEAHYHTIFETTGTATLVIEDDMTISVVNAEFERLSGYSRGEVEGKKRFIEFVPEEDRARLAGYHRARREPQGTAPAQYEARLIARGGKILHGIISVAVTPGTRRSVVSVLDITEMKRAREEADFRAMLLDSATDSIFVHDFEGRMLYVNEAAWKTRGYTREELLATPLNRLDTADYAARIPSNMERLRKSGEVVFESAHFRKDGSVLPVEVHARVIELGGRRLIMSAVRDISERKRAEAVQNETLETLVASEERFRSVVETANDAILTVDSDGIIVQWNRGAEVIFGLSREEVVGRHFTVFVPEQLKEAEEASFRRAMGAGKISRPGKSVERTAIRRDGTAFSAELTATLWETGQGRFITQVIRDITERKRMEQTLGESEERYRRLVEDIDDIIYKADLDGRVTYISPAVERMIGYRPDEILGRSFADFIPQADITEVDRKVKRVGGGEWMEIEARVVAKDGAIRYLRTAARPEMVAGKIVGTSGIASDITERHQAEQLFHSVAASSPVGIYIADKGKFIYVSEAFERQTGYSRDEILAMPTFSLVHTDDRAAVRENAVAMLKGRRLSPYEYRLVTRSGEVRWMLETCTSIGYQGRRVTLGNVMNVTEYKRLERQVVEYHELEKMKSDLLSTVSHELRTPLATIKGYSSMLVDYDKALGKKEKTEYLVSIDTATDRLTELVDHLLDMSRLEAGLMKLDRISVNLRELVQAAVVEAGVRSPGHRFVYKPGRRLPPVSADNRRIRQVVDNLIDNAVKYSGEGTAVTVRVTRSGGEAVVSVADQGVGISKEDLPRVFDTLFRAKHRLSSQVSGLGLGLSICKALVEAHGGRIWLESEPGKGTTAYFTLPLIDDAGRSDVTGKK